MPKQFEGFIKTPFSRMRLQGAPVMPGDEVTTVLSEKTEDLRRAVSRLTLLHSKDALTLLRYSLSIPKLLYTLRTPDLTVTPCAGRVRQDLMEWSVGHLECRDV